MERPKIKPPQVQGMKSFLVHLPDHFSDYEIQQLPSSTEFRRMAQAVRFCEAQQKQKGKPPQSAEDYDYSCITRNICPTVSKQFIQCWQQAQTNPNLVCEAPRRAVEVCVGEHVSQSVATMDVGGFTSKGHVSGADPDHHLDSLQSPC